MASPLSPEIKARVQEEDALEALAKACSHPVQFACCAGVGYRGQDSPLPTYTASFQKGDYLHFKEQYNENWWIGRVIGDETSMGFLPSEAKLLKLTSEVVAKEQEQKEVYRLAPIMRPIVLVGPSTRDAQLTELLQKALVNFMKEKFARRLVTIKPDSSVATMTSKEAKSLNAQVYQAGVSLSLIFLDCDASFPSDLTRLQLHPHFVYIQITRLKVLHKLVKETTANSRERDAQLEAAYRLYENPHPYSLILSDSNLDDACQNLELFLESYWAATRSIQLSDTTTNTPASQRRNTVQTSNAAQTNNTAPPSSVAHPQPSTLPQLGTPPQNSMESQL